MRLPFDGLWAVLVLMLSFTLLACGNTGGDFAKTKTSSGSFAMPINGGGGSAPVTTVPTPTPTPSPTLPTPYQFMISGTGNHAYHLCIPATQKLRLRMKPHANWSPLFPASATPTYENQYGQRVPIYTGAPAYYTKLRLRMSIPGTSAAWDYIADLEQYSATGDYSQYLREVPETTVPETTSLPTPEYDDVWILGASPMDGLCTYWEKYFGKCDTISSELRISEVAGCAPGEQKILISRVYSDYPCQNDPIGWCGGKSMQVVTDYQQWIVTIEAATEHTQSF